MSEQSETKFRKKVQRDLDSLSGNSANFTIQQKTIRGDADKLLCIRGLFIWLELKKLSGKSGALQIYKRELVKRAGGIAFEAKPDNWEAIFEFLNQLDGGILDTDSLQRLGHPGISTELAETKAEPDANPSSIQRKAHRKGARRRPASV